MPDIESMTVFLRLDVDNGDVVTTKITFHGKTAQNPNAVSDAVRAVDARMRRHSGHHVETWAVITPDEYDAFQGRAPRDGKETFIL